MNPNRKFDKMSGYKDDLMAMDYHMRGNSEALDSLQRVPMKNVFRKQWNSAFYYNEYPVMKTVKIFKKL